MKFILDFSVATLVYPSVLKLVTRNLQGSVHFLHFKV